MTIEQACYRTINDIEYQIGELINGEIVFQREMIFDFLTVSGQYYFKNFKINTIDEDVILKMCTYFLGSREQCSQLGLDTNKGLLLYGGVGVGKTTLIQLIPLLQINSPHIPLYSTSELSEQFSINGPQAYEIINLRKSFILDDIGSENKSNYYGTSTEVVSDLIKKFDGLKNQIKPCLNINYGTKSKGLRAALPFHSKIYATTNCDLQQINDRYGCRTTSRLGGLFNCIDFSSMSIDKRINRQSSNY